MQKNNYTSKRINSTLYYQKLKKKEESVQASCSKNTQENEQTVVPKNLVKEESVKASCSNNTQEKDQNENKGIN